MHESYKFVRILEKKLFIKLCLSHLTTYDQITCYDANIAIRGAKLSVLENKIK